MGSCRVRMYMNEHGEYFISVSCCLVFIGRVRVLLLNPQFLITQFQGLYYQLSQYPQYQDHSQHHKIAPKNHPHHKFPPHLLLTDF